MFTGLVEGLGQVAAVVKAGPGIDLEICAPEIFGADLPEIGDSVALNGCCLTVVRVEAKNNSQRLFFQAGSETLLRTNLGKLTVGSIVNCERSLIVGARIGGHFVQGHVDGTTTITAIVHEGEWVMIDFALPADLSPLLVEKGSIAVDGVSLTIARLTDDSFRVALIPHTVAMTTFGQRQVGDTVNLEVDMLAKHCARLLEPLLSKPA